MFDLELSITTWRRQMRARGNKSSDVLDELESHLREEVARQMLSGAGAQEAFESAVDSFGPPEALRVEFAKLEAAGGRSGFLRTCLYIFPACMWLINTWTLLAYDLSPLERAVGISAVTLFSLYLVCHSGRVNPRAGVSFGLLAKATKLAIHVLVLWVWPLWAILGSLEVLRSGLGIVATTVLWCLYAAVAMTVFAEALKPRCRRSGGSGGSAPPLQPMRQPVPPPRPRPPAILAC